MITWCVEVLNTVWKQKWNEAREKMAAEKRGQGKQGTEHLRCDATEKTAAKMKVEIMKNSKHSLPINSDHLGESY